MMLSFLTIFISVAVLFFASLKIIDLIFNAKIQFKLPYMKGVFRTTSLLVWFCLGTIATFLISTVLVKIPTAAYKPDPVASQIPTMAIEKQDCQRVIDTIYSTENSIYKLENHRYIEEISPVFTIKIDYKKGAEKLDSAAKKYRELEVAESTKPYTQAIADKLEQKAELFTNRSEAEENSKGIKKVIYLLDEMDRATEQRQQLIDALERQCNS